MIKQLWWVALASGLACSSSGQGSADTDDDTARARSGSGTELPAGDLDPGASAAEKLRLLETATGLVVQVERDGQKTQLACAGTCNDVCQGCLLEACQLSAAPGLCNSAAEACENRCNACVSVNGQTTCDAPSCVGDLSCYFVTVGVPEEFRDVVRGVSGEPGSPLPPPGTSDPAEPAATPAEPNVAEPGSGDGRGT